MMSGRGYDGDLWHEAVDPGCPHINRCGVRAKDILAASFTAVGVVLNVVCGVSRITMEDIIKGVWPFMIAQLIVLFLLVLFPVLVTGPAKCFGG
jgi:sorbitol-specific phosphotransferase system component IIBC